MRWSRTIVDARAAYALSRSKRWRSKRSRSMGVITSAGALVFGAMAGFVVLSSVLPSWVMGSAPVHSQLSSAGQIVLAQFPEAIHGHAQERTDAAGGYHVTFAMPAYLLTTADASENVFERLAGEFGFGARPLGDIEIATRMRHAAVLGDGSLASGCRSHTLGAAPYDLAQDDPLRVIDLKLSFAPTC